MRTMFWRWLCTAFRRGLRMMVANQAIFSVGEPQQETIGRTSQTLRMSEVISAVSNLWVLSNTCMVGSLVLWALKNSNMCPPIPLDHSTDLSRVRSLSGLLDFPELSLILPSSWNKLINTRRRDMVRSQVFVTTSVHHYPPLSETEIWSSAFLSFSNFGPAAWLLLRLNVSFAWLIWCSMKLWSCFRASSVSTLKVGGAEVNSLWNGQPILLRCWRAVGQEAVLSNVHECHPSKFIGTWRNLRLDSVHQSFVNTGRQGNCRTQGKKWLFFRTETDLHWDWPPLALQYMMCQQQGNNSAVTGHSDL